MILHQGPNIKQLGLLIPPNDLYKCLEKYLMSAAVFSKGWQESFLGGGILG